MKKDNIFFTFLNVLAKKTIAQIILVIIICLLVYDTVSIGFIRYMYSISLAMKSVLIFILPFLIMSAIATAFAKIPRGGFLFAVSLLLGVTFSNFLNLTISYFFTLEMLNLSDPVDSTPIPIEKIGTAFAFNMPKNINNGYALIIGLVTGISCSLFNLKKLEGIANKMNNIVVFFMSKIFGRLLPIFIMGFLLKLLHEGELSQLLQKQFWPTISVVFLITGWLSIWFIVASGFNIFRTKEIFMNIFPAMVTAFTTMSSAAAMPMALEAAEKNTKDKTLAYSVIPMIMNFHMLGSSMTVSVAVLMIMKAFHMPLPDYWHFAIFGFYFVMNKFAGAGVPAGSIIVVLPILKKTLGFSDDMTALILAFYIVFDPIITLANVTANNLFALFVQKFIYFFRKNRRLDQQAIEKEAA
jgi:Na+/H+-dicarboxylate symporter